MSNTAPGTVPGQSESAMDDNSGSVSGTTNTDSGAHAEKQPAPAMTPPPQGTPGGTPPPKETTKMKKSHEKSH